jgi:hypothetical protein
MIAHEGALILPSGTTSITVSITPVPWSVKPQNAPARDFRDNGADGVRRLRPDRPGCGRDWPGSGPCCHDPWRRRSRRLRGPARADPRGVGGGSDTSAVRPGVLGVGRRCIVRRQASPSRFVVVFNVLRGPAVQLSPSPRRANMLLPLCRLEGGPESRARHRSRSPNPVLSVQARSGAAGSKSDDPRCFVQRPSVRVASGGFTCPSCPTSCPASLSCPWPPRSPSSGLTVHRLEHRWAIRGPRRRGLPGCCGEASTRLGDWARAVPAVPGRVTGWWGTSPACSGTDKAVAAVAHRSPRARPTTGRQARSQGANAETRQRALVCNRSARP